MAAIETGTNNKHNNKQHLKKKNTTVDLTPMVDLGFLLITFFVFTTTMAQPKVMKVEMPYDKTTIEDPVCNSCALTVLLAKNDAIQYYEGEFSTAQLYTTNYKDIRDIIQHKKKMVQQVRGSADQFVLIIKATDSSLFKNFVDITDEVTINNIKRYYIDEITTAEKNKMGF